MNHSRKSPPIGVVALLPAAAILLGGFIYIYLRPSESIFMQWARIARLDGILHLVKPERPISGTVLPQWLVYSLPSGLWAFAYSLVISFLWAGKKHWIRYFWLSTIPLLVFGFEILQLSGTIPGTFSISDLVLGCLGSGAGVFVGIKRLKSNRYKK